ncbi:MAG: dienelactone hydrolase family protein [Armatimonadetes bacterium]|nr:dienelactone hydrolase family protein [Armatimonadota bacterium]
MLIGAALLLAAPFARAQAPAPLDAGAGGPPFPITYPSPVVTPYAANNTVTAFLFLPPGPGPYPAMVVLHEWNGWSGAQRLCHIIARAGVAALLVTEPYSLSRRTADSPGILSGDPPQMRDALQQAVLDARRGLDVLSRRPDIDPDRLGVAGISLGGILGGLVAGMDPRVKVVLTADAGAEFARGFWNGLLTFRFQREIRRRGYTFETFQAAMAPVEASRWLHGFNPDSALMFNGRYDLVVRPEQAEVLARALGGTRIVWANTGHYGLALSASSAAPVIVRFLRARFFGEGLPFRPPDTLPSQTIKSGLLLGGQEGVSPALAYQLLDFDRAGRYSLDGQLTLHGLSAALSARLGPTSAIGIQFPLGHGTAKPHPYVLFSLTL